MPAKLFCFYSPKRTYYSISGQRALGLRKEPPPTLPRIAGEGQRMRDAKITQIYEGTNQIQRNEIALNLIKGAAG